jgi:TPP-dependent indolepyruvate ferredoxin oxidoreductase alpha subunit
MLWTSLGVNDQTDLSTEPVVSVVKALPLGPKKRQLLKVKHLRPLTKLSNFAKSTPKRVVVVEQAELLLEAQVETLKRLLQSLA